MLIHYQQCDMKTLSVHILLVVLTVCSVQAQDKQANNIDNSNIALQGYSPVSYLDLGLAQRGLKDHKSTYAGITYYFTSSEQKEIFDRNPERYLPQYGGFCAFGIYIGAKFRVDPNRFIVQGDKYYLFLYDLEVDAQQLWLGENNHGQLVATANKNWEKLSRTYN